MSQPSVKQRLCQLLYVNERVSLVLAAVVGVVGVGLLVENLRAGEPLAEQLWFLAFAIAYGVGVRPLVASVLRE